MCVYADLLEQVQGIPPETVAVVTGDRASHVHHLADYAAYYRAAKARFVARIDPDAAAVATYPERAKAKNASRDPHVSVGVMGERFDDEWVQTWADAVKKAGNDPDAVLKDFKAVLAKYKSAY